MTAKIEIESAVRLARNVLIRERQPITPEPYQPTEEATGDDIQEAPFQPADNSAALEAIGERGLEVVRRL